MKSRYKIQEHLRSHTQEKAVACPTCGNLFSCFTKFKDHLIKQDDSCKSVHVVVVPGSIVGGSSINGIDDVATILGCTCIIGTKVAIRLNRVLEKALSVFNTRGLTFRITFHEPQPMLPKLLDVLAPLWFQCVRSSVLTAASVSQMKSY